MSQHCRVEYLCLPSHSFCHMAPLKLTFFGFLTIGSSCCHFSSGTKVSIFEKQGKTQKNLAGQEQGKDEERRKLTILDKYVAGLQKWQTHHMMVQCYGLV